jgi:hypothetical protein
LNHDRPFLFLGPAPPPFRAGDHLNSRHRTVAPHRVAAAAIGRRRDPDGAEGAEGAPPTLGSRHAGRRSRSGVNGGRSLNRDTICRPLALLEENVVSGAHAAQLGPVLPEDGALVANRL